MSRPLGPRPDPPDAQHCGTVLHPGARARLPTRQVRTPQK